MGIKMVIGFMITRRPLGRLPHFPFFAAVFGLLTVSCEKVPLLAPSTSSITLTATATALPLNGTTDLIAQVLEQAGTPPHSGTHVIFTTTLGSVQPPEAETDLSGRVVVKFLAGTASGTATIVASSGGAGSSTGATTGTGGTTATTATGAAPATVTVSVNVAPTITVGTPSPAAPPVGQSVTFPLTYGTDANSSAIQSVSVDFGDGGSQTLPGKPSSVSHTYTAPGSYSVRATATDALGDTSTGSASVLVAAKPQPVVSITATTTNPTAGTDVTFTASVTPAAGSGTNIADVVVDFGDGVRTDYGAVSGSAIALHHAYTVGGTYTVVLTATDTNGGVGTAATTVFVQTATPLTVLLSASPTPSGTNTTETFTATVIGLGNSVVVNYHWVFGSTLGTADTSSNQVTRT